MPQTLLTWYDRHRRSLPWRGSTDPYRVWLSEIMLQQTTVAAVIPYYENFLTRFPDVAALAAAESDEVMRAWAGLGYYARARNLHAGARAVVALGGFPRDIKGLRALPGIGTYTAAAIGAIAFGIPAVPIDGNVERVVARVFRVTEGGHKNIIAGAERLGSDPAARARPADFAQALFDLGAMVCTPVRPACDVCPWRRRCAGREMAGELPRKAPKKIRPVRFGVHFWLSDLEGRVLLRRRPPTGLLGGMMELPGTAWQASKWGNEALLLAPMAADWRAVGAVNHGFTHFALQIAMYAAEVSAISAPGSLCDITTLLREALPSVMRKCVRLMAPNLEKESPR